MARTGATRLSIRHLFLLVPVAGLAWAVTRPFRDNSFLWHVRAGTVQLDRGQVLTTDPFSIEFAGEAWRTQSWLADLMYGWLERATDGVGWLAFYMFALAAATIGVVLATTYRRSGHLAVTAAAGLLLAWQAVPFTAARPVIFSYLLLATVAAALLAERANWAIPPLIWVWAALHGSFVVGIGLVVLEAVRRRSRRHLELAAVATLLSTLTAHGIGVWHVLMTFFSNRDALELIREWQPPNYSNPFMVPYAILIFALLLGAVRGRLHASSLIVIGPFLFYGMLAVRNLYPAMIVVLPYVAAALTPQAGEKRRRDPLPVVAGFAAVIVGAGLVGLARPVPLSAATFPSAEALGSLRDGPVFHGIATGGYLIYAQWPERPVLVDDRAELFGSEGFSRYLDIADGKGWEAAFAELGIEQALLDPDWPLAAALATAGWNEVFRDENFVVATAP